MPPPVSAGSPERSKRICIAGVPPKKDGANSMWRKPGERERLKALRIAVLDHFPDGPLSPDKSVGLELRVYAPASAGDLDNFITGVCDGLQAAHPSLRRTINTAEWDDVPREARPDQPVLLYDDGSVDRVVAGRHPQGSAGPRYELVVDWFP
jgi:hypothetical protein